METERPGVIPLVPQEPLFSLAGLVFGKELRDGEAVYHDFFWARNAIFHGLRALGIQPKEKVLVPAYLCNAAIEPIIHFGAEVEFYAVRRTCDPDWADLEAKIPGARAVMAVHYFGFPCEIERFRALRDRYHFFLIEDCAHVLEGVSNLGQAGDLSVYSPRKHLPIFDGGRLRLNRPPPGFRAHLQFESPLFTLRVAKDLIERRKPPAKPLSVSTAAPEQGDTVAGGELPPVPARPVSPLQVVPSDTSFLPTMADFPMSRLSRLLLPHFPLERIAGRRRANYRYLLDRIARLPNVCALARDLPAGVTPWVLPIMIGERPGAHIALRARGIPAVTWGGVRSPRVLAVEFPEADFLYEHLIFLPVHQDLNPADLDVIADAVDKVGRMGY